MGASAQHSLNLRVWETPLEHPQSPSSGQSCSVLGLLRSWGGTDGMNLLSPLSPPGTYHTRDLTFPGYPMSLGVRCHLEPEDRRHPKTPIETLVWVSEWSPSSQVMQMRPGDGAHAPICGGVQNNGCPQDVHILIPGTCEYVTFHSRSGSVRALRWGHYPG